MTRTPPARHQNRDFRTRASTPAPDHTIAAIAEGQEDGGAASGKGGSGSWLRRFRGASQHWNPREEAVLLVCGACFLLAAVVPSPLIAILTLPAALLAPGHVVMRSLGQGFDGDGDPWLPWALRVVLSLAVWTVAGAIVVVTPGLDPRGLGTAAGVLLLMLTAVRWLRLHDRPGPARSWHRPGVTPREAAVLAGFAVVAAAAIGGAYVISSTGPAAPQPFVALNFAQPRAATYDDTGAVLATVVVANASGDALKATLETFVDGRRVLVKKLTVPENDSVQVPLRELRAPTCWTSLRIQLTGMAAGLRPLPLYAYGPATLGTTCPAPSRG